MDTNATIDRDIEAIYPLTPMQQGMLFHSVLDPDSGVYVQCTVATLTSTLNVDALWRAWRSLIDRHGILRTAFLWEGLDRPLQVIQKSVELDWLELDWSTLNPAAAPCEIEALVDAEVRRGFAIDRPPLMRMTLVRMPDASWRQVWTYHHILLDGWSLPILFDELSQLYAAFLDHRVPNLRRPPEFRSYVTWLQRQDASAAAAYWERELRGLTAPTVLPGDRSAGKDAGSTRLGSHIVELGAELSLALTQFTRASRLTLSTVLQAAWALVLSNHSGETDVLFGATVSGRPPELADVETIVGPFINSIPVRITVPTDMPVLHWIEALQHRAAEREQFSYSALTDIQRDSAIPAGTAMFDTLLVVENYPLGRVLGGERDALEMHDFATRERTNLKLTINVVAGETIHVLFRYDHDQYRAKTIARIAEHFRTLLSGIASDPLGIIASLPSMTDTERNEVLRLSYGARAQFPDRACLHHIIEAQVASTPDAVAAVFGTESLTYAQLNSRANRLAHHLTRLDVGPNTLVAVCLERSLDMMVALLAVLKAGGAYVPIDPGYPSDRVAYMLGDAQAPVVLTQTRLRHLLPDGKTTILMLDEDVVAWASCPETDPRAAVTATDLAYVIYTSGSTGRPKGAMNSHRGIINRLTWMQREYALTTADRILQKTPFSFDVSVWEFFWPLMTGASLVLAKPGGHRDNAYLTELINREGITTLHFVPSMLQAMLDEPTVRRCQNLKRVICSGEALPADLAKKFFDVLPLTELHNLYGPTECAVDVTSIHLKRDEISSLVPIGRPIANTNIYVLNARRQVVPIGVSGEIHIGGVQVGGGYLNRPELTAESFVDDPFVGVPGGTMYRTGDIGRWLPNGALEYLGRKDQQVKLRGFRIELGEIEAQIKEHFPVRDAMVVVREDRPGDRRLAAYLVPPVAASIDVETVRSHLRQSLPEYMVPAAFVVLDALPLNANGKIDRNALPAPDYGSEQKFVAPRTATETILAEIVADVLGVPTVGVTDSFFDLGGDSILLLQVIARARAASLRLTARQILDHPNVAALAEIAEARTDGELAWPNATAAKVGPAGPVPMTPIQRWFFTHAPHNPQHFNQSALLTITAELSDETLERALHELALHHEALRLRVVEAAGEQRQMQIAATPSLPLLEFSTVDSTSVGSEADRVQASLNIVDGPILRAVLFRGRHGRPARLLIVIHHLAVDGVSWRILLEDLETFCRQIAGGEPIKLQPATSSFASWSLQLHDYARTERLRAELNYWQAVEQKDRGAIPTDYTADRSRNTYGATKTVHVALDANRTDALLHSVPKFYQSQINDVLLAALARTLTEWTGRPDVLVNVEGHGREELFEDLDLSRTVGWFTSLFPVALSSGPKEPTAAVDVIKTMLRAVPFRGVGYGVQRYLGADAGFADWADPDVCFNYLGQINSARSADTLFELMNEPTGALADPANRRAHLLDIIGEVRDGRMAFGWTFSRNFHRKNSIERLAQRFIEVLSELIDHAARQADPGALRETFEYDPIVVIQTGNRRGEPVVCVPGIGGSVIYFSPLAQRLGHHTPVYGMQPRGFDSDISPHTTISEMADAYVEAIRGRKTLTTRRLRLLGHSLGAMVVFEMARRLRPMGFELAPIVLLDPPTLLEMTTEREKPGPDVLLSRITQFLTNRYGALFDVSDKAWLELSEDGRIEFLRQKMVHFKLISARTPFEVVRSKVRMVMAHGNLDYWPSGSYPDDVVILRPTKDYEEDGAADLDPSTGWVRFAPRLRVLESEGDHMTILDHVTMNALMRNLVSVWGDDETATFAEHTLIQGSV